MEKTQYLLSAASAAILTFVTSCASLSTEDTYVVDREASGTSRLEIRISGKSDTRSSISPDEKGIQDICVMAYNDKDGRLTTIQTGAYADDIDMELASGTYNIYVTANMGEFNAPADESQISSTAYIMESFSEMGNALPMCWKGKVVLKPGETTTISADMSRLVSKVGLNVETGGLKGLEITSVRLCQGAKMLKPFMEGGSRISDPVHAVNGDYATETDLRKLKSGETVYFYVTENCQGVLLPGNVDPWSKVPDRIGNKAKLCTYVEMVARWNDSADYEGTVTYRFFLGEDAVTDFNVKGNSIHNVTLYLEEDSFDKVSWKIDASQMYPVNWNLSSSLKNNFHDRDDFYITENIRIDFSFDDKGIRYWNKRNNEFHLEGIGNNGRTAIKFRKPVDLGNGRFYAIGTCIDSGYYDIVLMNSNTGEMEYIMENGTIHVPEIAAGVNNIYIDDPVERFDEESEFTINGDSQEICLYLTDKEGYNLNQSHYYGCDFSICRWDLRILNEDYDYDLCDKAAIESFDGISGSDSYAIRYRLRFDNDGKDPSWNGMLTSSLGRGMLAFTYEELTSGASGQHGMSLFCDDIEITFKPVPDDRKNILQSEFMFVVENTSNLPLEIRGLKLNSMKSVPFRSDVMAVTHKAISGHTSNIPLLISKMPYTYCSLEPGAARHTTIGGKLCFAADDYGIQQSDIPEQMSMYHTFEATFAHIPDYWVPSIFGSVNLYDTSAHNQTYGRNGYDNCGVTFHTYDESHIHYDSNNGLNTDFKKYGGLLDKSNLRKFHDILEVQIGINENNQIIATASRQADFKISINGKINGHIRCVTIQDPFYTVWGHYFTDSQPFSHEQTIRLGSNPVVIDGSALAEAFVKMREIPYYSLLDAWNLEEFRVDNKQGGTIREYLKPYGIDLTIDITSSSGIPTAVRFSGSTQYSYKTSSPVTWSTGLLSSVTMVPSSHSGFDSRLDDDDCPPGSLFASETLYIQPDVTFDNHHGLYYMTK